MKKILLVEDDFFVLDIYTKLFQKEYEVDTAVNGEEALNKINVNSYDMILLDLMIPKIDGLEVLRTARMKNSHAYNVPILILTNLGQEDIVKQAFSLGADGYLVKSAVEPKDVLSQVKLLFENKDNKPLIK